MYCPSGQSHSSNCRGIHAGPQQEGHPRSTKKNLMPGAYNREEHRERNHGKMIDAKIMDTRILNSDAIHANRVAHPLANGPRPSSAADGLPARIATTPRTTNTRTHELPIRSSPVPRAESPLHSPVRSADLRDGALPIRPSPNHAAREVGAPSSIQFLQSQLQLATS
jgi:hypothetical protein